MGWGGVGLRGLKKGGEGFFFTGSRGQRLSRTMADAASLVTSFQKHVRDSLLEFRLYRRFN